MPDPRDIAYEILLCLQEKKRGGPISLTFEEELAPLSGPDRALCIHIVKGVIQKKAQIDQFLKASLGPKSERIDKKTLILLRMACYQLLYLSRVPQYALVDTVVELAKTKISEKAARFLNWCLREILRRGMSLDHAGSPGHPDISGNFPPWLIEMWQQELKGDVKPLLQALSIKQPLTLRINPLFVDRELVLKLLSEKGIRAYPTTIAPHGIVLPHATFPQIKKELVDTGIAQVQSEPSQLAGLILDPKPWEKVLDLCCGMGTKGLYMAQLMGGKGWVLGVDNSIERLKKFKEMINLMGLENIGLLCADILLDIESTLRGSFDKILLDVPCSGLGTIAKRPDILSKISPERIKRLSQIQYRMLKAASFLLKKGGHLLYVTCTISFRENEGNILKLIEEHPGLRLISLRDHDHAYIRDIASQSGFIKILPHLHGMDGFFFALLEKI